MDERRLEEWSVALSRQLYAEGVGLPWDEEAVNALAAKVEAEYGRGVDDPASRDMALDGLDEAQGMEWDTALEEAMDSALIAPDIQVAGEPVTWRNWRQAERELADAGTRRRLFARFVEASSALTPAIEGRYDARRQLYAAHGTTPLEVFARQEGTTAEGLRDLALRLGEVCREPFQAALQDMARQVFGPGEVTAAELRALYLNRMYEPLAPLFARRDPVGDVRAAFARLGFAIDHIQMDFEDRPTKYPGAFCFVVHIPNDVRVSVRPASPHHLADMLFHELGHAVHFSGIDPTLSFAQRYWIHAGTHETFSTLFESLLGLPQFLREGMGFDRPAIDRLLAFDRYKILIIGTWLVTSGLAACDAWIEGLPWAEVEQRYAAYCHRFTGVTIDPGFARLGPFVNDIEPYPLGYVIAAVRVAHWLEQLEADYGVRWWAEPRAGEDIRDRIRLGGAVRFDEGWLDPGPLIGRWVEQP